MSESSTCTTEVSQQLSDLPPEMEERLSTTSFKIPKWHRDVDKQDPSVISCKICQTQYLCLKL